MSQCRLCQQPIKFEQNENDKWVPLNSDGTSHFESCPEIRRRRELYFKDSQPTSKELIQKHLGKEQTFLEDFGLVRRKDV